MTAQVYDTQRNQFLTTFIPQEPPYYFDFYLGEFTAYTAIKNSSNEFISLGGSKESPLIYKFQETGITDFTFSIIAPNYPRVTDIHPSFAWYELWIDGDKPYYFFFGLQTDILFTRTVSVFATKGKITKFKFRLTIHFVTPNPDLKKYYFEGDPDTVYSSITAKFISDPVVIEEKKSPIVLTSDSVIKMNQRYIVKAPILKKLQLTIDENCKEGDYFEIKNMGLGNFQINTGDKIDIIMDGRTTRLKNGYVQSKKMGDFLRLECMETSPKIIFSDIHNIGSFTII